MDVTDFPPEKRTLVRLAGHGTSGPRGAGNAIDPGSAGEACYFGRRVEPGQGDSVVGIGGPGIQPDSGRQAPSMHSS